jgi:hypothetical protein
MTDAIPGIWFGLLTGRNPDQSRAIDEVERLLRGAPPSAWRDHGLDVIEAARANDADAQRQLADSLAEVYCRLPRAKTPTRAPKPPRQRKPSLARLVAKAKQLGVDVTIEPDGAATFRTGSSTMTTAEGNSEVDEWIAKHAH